MCKILISIPASVYQFTLCILTAHLETVLLVSSVLSCLIPLDCWTRSDL